MYEMEKRKEERASGIKIRNKLFPVEFKMAFKLVK
jgi:hypothetical protein